MYVHIYVCTLSKFSFLITKKKKIHSDTMYDMVEKKEKSKSNRKKRKALL